MALFLLPMPIAYGAPGDLCFEQGNIINNCNFIDAPLEALVEPFEAIFGVWFFPIVWGVILGILWIRTQNTMLVGIVGVMVAGMIGTIYEPALSAGILLFVVAMGITLYGLIQYKLENPQT